MLRLAVLAVALTGCDAVFGLSDVHAPADGPRERPHLLAPLPGEGALTW